MCFTGVFLENKHFVREWGKRHQKSTPKAFKNHLKKKPPILNFVCVFLIKTMCFVGVILGKGHSVREWGQNSKKKFYVFSVFVQKPGSKRDPQITPKSRKTTLEPILKQCKKHKDSREAFSHFLELRGRPGRVKM
mgnify:CR=1 FL=1